ncbi:DUF6626 family protein [Rhizobium sp. SYY.PMSO]|uniref:DUF6626 family protein n=1 Tax=Rhizobium sp. SYY.PMSO TaxID=3382192 RepID=UPI00398FF508
MKIKEIYGTLSDTGLASSQMKFSQIWLGRSPRYYSHLIAVGREPGLATLCGINWRLEQLLGHSSPASNPQLVDLKRRLTAEIERRAITDIRRHSS